MKTNLIALTGLARSGKNTAADLIQELCPELDVRQDAFANDLKSAKPCEDFGATNMMPLPLVDFQAAAKRLSEETFYTYQTVWDAFSTISTFHNFADVESIIRTCSPVDSMNSAIRGWYSTQTLDFVIRNSTQQPKSCLEALKEVHRKRANIAPPPMNRAQRRARMRK